MPPNQKTVVMLGATGTAGYATTTALRDAGHRVIAVGRRDPEVRDVAFRRLDLGDAQAIAGTVQGLKPWAVVSALASRSGALQDAWRIDHDAHLHMLRAAQSAGTERFVLMSAICVQKPKLAFQYAKLAFEEALVASPLTYSIVRPTALFKSLSGQLARVQAGKPYLMFGDGRLTACKPISDRDLGRYMAACLTDETRQNRILPIGGPGPALTPADMGAELFRQTGRTPRYKHVPLRLLDGIAGGLRLGGALSSTLRAKAELARIGRYYASESMLVWDPAQARYDADATPEFGEDRLFDHYADLIAGHVTLDRRDHAVF